MRTVITTLLDLIGAAAVTAGSYAEFGLGWALIVGGAFLLTGSYFAADHAAGADAEPGNDEAWA